MEIVENFSCLEQNLEVLSRQMDDLKHIKYQVATREERNMDGWLENVEGREREFDEIRKEFGILRSKIDDVINLIKETKKKDVEALKTFSQKVSENLKAVNVLRDKGNASIESSPAHSKKMIHKTFAYEDLIKFTSKFTEDVGSGGFSKVYKGKLDDDKQVAVKVLKNSVVIGDFMAEMQTMMMASHPNLVTLHGFCFDYNMKALVYDFMENGSLDKILFDNHLSVEWGELYRIALGTAKGLAYLHDGCCKQIIHRDMKPANVLLDENLSAKITDFGLAKLLGKDADHYTITNQNRGTQGYTAPEFGCLASKITKKCDVYSFGVTLFEVLRKRRNHGRGEDWFPLQVWTKFKMGKLDELIESFGIPETHKGKAKILSMVAFWCSQYTVETRPSMSTVVEVLEKEISVKAPPYPYQEYFPPPDTSMLPSQEVNLDIHSEASTVIHGSLANSNPTLVAEEKKDKAGKDSDDKQAISNSSEQLQHEEIKTSSEIEKLPSELETARPQSFSLSDLKMYTSNFSDKIGSGGYGVVYKGQFLDGMEVAVKVLHDMEVFDKTFMDVVMTLEMVNHPNIVKLHGYCFDGNMKALVHEYIGNGSLDTILYRNRPDIEWEQLYEIAIETAMGLSVLHAAGFIHRDIKASNILLDCNLSPKIRSYGFMKDDDDVTIRPASWYTRNSSTEMRIRSLLERKPTLEVSKSDVYSFGTLLFEVLGRRKMSTVFQNHVWEMFNKGLPGQVREDCGINYKDRQKAFTLSKVALWCAQDNPQKRPSMSSVVKMLEMEIPVMDPPDPFSRRGVLESKPLFPKWKRKIYSEASPSIELSSVISNPTLVAGRPQKFSHLDITRFTSNFSEKIGNGGYGVVYKGKFLDGMEVAIKVLHDIDETVMDEVMTMEMVYHPNIVKLHGYCFDWQMKVLVYEYIEKGSLDIILYSNHLQLKCGQLYEIATETAKGLSILHDVGIIHNDIKASNILLNSNLSPKIRSSVLGGHFIMKRNDDSTRIAGSYGYSAPETWIPTSEVTSKSDVYSFGMLLFEVLGRRCISNHRGKEWFPAQVWMMFDKGLLGKVVMDCGINEEDRKKALNLSKVALWCAQFDPQKRPSMRSVVEMLEMKIPVMDPPNPFPYAQLSSTSSSPEGSPRFNSEASTSIELSFHEKRSVLEKSKSGGDLDRAVLSGWRSNRPGFKYSVVLYTTAGWHWQDRLAECNYVTSILKSHQVEIIERDISANWDYWVELRKLLDRTEVPALFVHGKFIGGVNEVKSLEEQGKLKLLLYAVAVKKRMGFLEKDLRKYQISREELDSRKFSMRRTRSLGNNLIYLGGRSQPFR